MILDILCLGPSFLKGTTGEYNLMEIERNIQKRLPAILDVYRSHIRKLQLEIVPLPLLKAVKSYFGKIADKDAPVLASAVISGTDYLVTEDKKDFGPFRNDASFSPKIISPAELVILLGGAYSE